MISLEKDVDDFNYNFFGNGKVTSNKKSFG